MKCLLRLRAKDSISQDLLSKKHINYFETLYRYILSAIIKMMSSESVYTIFWALTIMSVRREDEAKSHILALLPLSKAMFEPL